MKRTIIYVFGPKRLAAKYFANDEMVHQEHRRGYVAIPALPLCSEHCLRSSRACAVRYA